MTQINHTKIPEGAEIFTPMNKPRITPRRKDSKKRGAFLRFIEHQSQSV